MKKSNLKNLLIKPEQSIGHAINLLELSKKKILFVAKNKKLIGSFEDIDLRRALVKKQNLNNKIIKACNLKPKFVYDDISFKEKIRNINSKYNCVAIPILNKKKEIIDIIFNKSISKNQKEQKIPSLIMAGGLGKRLKPITNTIPKPIVRFKKIPIIISILKNLNKHNCSNIYVSVKYKKNKIISLLRNSIYKNNIEFISEKKFLGTAGCLYYLKNKIEDNIFVINGDTLIDIDLDNLNNFQKINKLDFTVVTKTMNFEIPYAMVKTQNKILKSIEEKPFFTKNVILGAYLINKKCLKLLKNIKIDMPDFIEMCINKKLRIGYYPISGSFKHITKFEDLK